MGETKKNKVVDEREKVIRIKKALNKAHDAADISMTKLAKDIYNIYGKSLEYKTLCKQFKENDYSLNYSYLIYICRYYGFDIDKLLFPDEEIDGKEPYRDCADPKYKAYKYADRKMNTDIGDIYSDHPFISSLSNVKEDYIVLMDNSYIGTFYGYFASEDSKKESPNKFTLTIENDEMTGMKATLRTKMFYKESDGKRRVEELYHGVPILSKAANLVIIFMVNDENGAFKQICFSYEKYRKGMGLIYRQGILLSGDPENEKVLGMQNCLLFNKEVEKSNDYYLLGLLKVPNHTFCVPVQDASKLAENDPDVAYLLENYEISLKKQEVYMIKEDSLINEASSKERINVIKALLHLKHISELQNVFHYRAKYRFRKFGLRYLAGVQFEVDEDN